jgi:hypothetical protein
MASNVIGRLPHWQRLALVAVALPVLVGLAVIAFAWPTARTEPRQLPVGVIGSTAGNQLLIRHVPITPTGGFDFHLYPDDASARAAIRARDIYGAFQVTRHVVRLMDASAASPAVAQALERMGSALARESSLTAASQHEHAVQLHVEDVVPMSSDDAKGFVFGSCLLPLTICSMLAAAAVGLLVRFRPAWRQILALSVVAAISGAVVYLIGQNYLDAFPGDGFADWAILALTIFAISGSTAGLIALIGTAGLGLGAALMVFIGNPFAAVASAPELLPTAVNRLGQLLPPGAGANALRSTAYFDGNGADGHVAVLIGWSVIGMAALILGHHAPIQLAAYEPPDDDDRSPRAREHHPPLDKMRARIASALVPDERMPSGVSYDDDSHSRPAPPPGHRR